MMGRILNLFSVTKIKSAYYALVATALVLIWSFKFIFNYVRDGSELYHSTLGASGGGSDGGHSVFQAAVLGLVWALAGAGVYMAIWTIIKLLADTRNQVVVMGYSHPKGFQQKAYLRHLFLEFCVRLAASILILFNGLSLLFYTLPKTSFAVKVAVTSPSYYGNWLVFGVYFLLIAVQLHLAVASMKLIRLSYRI